MIIDTLRSVRIFKIALFDLVSSLLLVGYFIYRNHKELSTLYLVFYTVLLTLILSTTVHYIFGIRTQLNVF